MKALLIIFLLSAMYLHSLADYLVLNRKTSIKVEPSSASAPLIQLPLDTELLLLDDGNQTNGYYHVTGEKFEDGWIYRTFVKRVPGPAPYLSTLTVEVRVLDVGPGLCTLIKLPRNKYVIYDTGHKQWSSDVALQQISQHIGKGSEIEMMVLSHNHADHMGGASQLIKNYRVKKVLWTGYHEPPVSEQGPLTMNQKFMKSLSESLYPIDKINLFERDSLISPGTTIEIDGARLIFLCGFNKPQSEWLETLKGTTFKGERINSTSIVMKLEYRGNSVLFTGDAVGRLRGAAEDFLIGTEKFLIEHAREYLPSTVLIAPHHGGDNSSSMAFVDAVKPKRVIFSAGHEYNHPTARAAIRYLKYVSPEHIYRTDRGDDEREEGQSDFEWDFGRIDGCIDGPADDDILIKLLLDKSFEVSHTNTVDPCSSKID